MDNLNEELLKSSQQLLNDLIKLRTEQPQLKYLRVCWVDVGNKIRTKSLNIDWLLKREPDLIHVTVTDVCMSLISFQDIIIKNSLKNDGIDGFGEVFLIPDRDSKITVLPYSDGKSHCQIFASFYKVDVKTKNLIPWSFCPRNAIKQSISRLSENYNLSVKGSFEVEFYLIRQGQGQGQDKELIMEPGNELDSGTFASFHSLDCYGDILKKITESLSEQGIPIEQLLSESGPGQFEITIDYTDILEACDRHIIVRQTLHSVASINGWMVTLIPKPYDSSAGNGCHVHLSLWDNHDFKNITPLPISQDNNSVCGIGLITQYFIGGVLKHAKSLTALFNTTRNSYERLQPNCWSGCNISWGLDNKESLVRIPSNPFYLTKGCSNFEIKTIDHSSNPYLAISGIIQSGIDGIENSINPPPPTSSFDQSNKEESLIPSNLSEALQYLMNNNYLCTNIGSDIIKSFIQLKIAENEILQKLSINETRLKLLELY